MNPAHFRLFLVGFFALCLLVMGWVATHPAW